MANKRVLLHDAAGNNLNPATLLEMVDGLTADWFELGTQIPNNTDLDAITTIGKYWAHSAGNATFANTPTETSFAMFVFKRNTNDYKTQLLFDYNNRVYARSYQSDGWAPWRFIGGYNRNVSSEYTFTRTGGTAGSAGAVTAYRDGNVVQISLNITTTAATASGSNLFTGKLSGGPLPAINTRLFSYVGGYVVIGDLTTSGNVTVRACGGSCPATTYSMLGSFITNS